MTDEQSELETTVEGDTVRLSYSLRHGGSHTVTGEVTNAHTYMDQKGRSRNLNVTIDAGNREFTLYVPTEVVEREGAETPHANITDFTIIEDSGNEPRDPYGVVRDE